MNFLCFLIIANISFASINDISTAIQNPKATELDTNNNGKPDYFRSFFSNGKIKSIKYDYDEDGNLDYSLEIDANGYKRSEFLDLNFDGKIDYKVECTKTNCIRMIDKNFDGKFEYKNKMKAERLAQANGKINEVSIFNNFISKIK